MKFMKYLIVNMLSLVVGSGLLVSAQSMQSDQLEIAAQFGAYKPIGVSVTQTNRLFVSFPKQSGPYMYGLTEIIQGERVPYPDAQWNQTGDAAQHFLSVQDLFVDAADYLWVLDSKPAPSSSIFGDTGKETEGQFKLLKINTGTDALEQVYTFEDLDKSRSGLNDVRVDLKHNLAYLSDPGQAAIVVLDLKTGQSRTVLESSPYTLADTSLVLAYQGREMRNAAGQPFRSNVNGIALSPDFSYLYFKPINQTHLYRIETRYLADATLSSSELEAKVEDMGEVGVTHGLVADKKGNVYLTTSLDYTIKYLSPDGSLHTLVQDARLLWPDSMGISGDGYLYVSCAQLQRDPQWNQGKDRVDLPYTVFRIKLP